MTKPRHWAQTGLLLKTNLRRDWVVIIFWLMGMGGLMAIAASKFDTLYASQKSVEAIVATLKTPAMIALFGPAPQAPYTTAVLYASEMVVFMGLMVVLMNLHFAIKNTRGEEDKGIWELIRAHSVGRGSPLMAVVLELAMVNLLNGILIAISLESANMRGETVSGSWLFGLGLGVFGFLFAGFGLLAAQLASNSASARRLSYTFLTVTFMARMITDVRQPSWTGWTIYGLIEKLGVYTHDRWEILFIMLGFALILAALSFYLNLNRDINAGLIATRQGRTRASVLLRGPLSLLWRLQRATICFWMTGLFLLGVSYGTVFGHVGDLLKSNPALAKMMESGQIAQSNERVILIFAATLSIIFAVVATIPALMIVLNLNREEQKGWLEMLHAKSVSRLRLMSSYVGLAFICGALGLLLGLVGMGLSGQQVSEQVSIWRLLRAFPAYLPVVWFVTAIGTLLVALWPRGQQFIWLLPSYGFFVMYMGGLLDLPKWAEQLTPYGWINRVPLAKWQFTQSLWLLGLTAIVLIISYWVYTKRDLTVR